MRLLISELPKIWADNPWHHNIISVSLIPRDKLHLVLKNLIRKLSSTTHYSVLVSHIYKVGIPWVFEAFHENEDSRWDLQAKETWRRGFPPILSSCFDGRHGNYMLVYLFTPPVTILVTILLCIESYKKKKIGVVVYSLVYLER